MAERKDLKAGYGVRRRADGRTGKVVDFLDDAQVTVLWDGDRDVFAASVAELERLPLNELQLLERYKELSDRKARLAKELEEAASDRAKAEEELVKYLQDSGKDSTASYDGLGRAEITGVDVFASIVEENRPAAYQALRELERGDLIKETVNPKSLSSFVSELVGLGREVPKAISYFLRPKLALRKR